MFRCYTLDNDKIEEGIQPDSFDCLIPTEEGSPFMLASVKLIPVLDYVKPCLDTAHLSLAFVKQEPSNGTPARGSIVSLNTNNWGIATKVSTMMLLDPCGSGGNILLFLPPGSDNILVKKTGTSVIPTVVGTDADGIPTMHTKNKGVLMLESLGLDVTEVFPAQDRAVLAGTSTKQSKPCKRTRRATR